MGNILEAAVRGPEMNFSVLANLLFCALFIFLKPSAMFEIADHEALPNGLQNPMTSCTNLF